LSFELRSVDERKIVRLAVYKTKFFDYLAGNLRRLAEILSVEPVAEKQDFTDEKILSPIEDWHEKTRDVSPEQWFEFSGENEFEPEAQTRKSSFEVQTGEADFVLKKPKKQPPGETSFENKREPARQAEASNNPEISLTGKSKKPKSETRFFRFNPAGKKPKDETSATLEPQSKISGQSSPEDEKPLAAMRQKFRLLPAQIISESSRKTSDAPNIINYAENQPPKFEVPTFERKKSSAVKLSEIAPSKPKKTIETTEPVVKKSSARPEFSDQFPLKAFEGKNENETTEISFKFPPRKATDEPIFTSKIKETTAGNPKFSAPWKKSPVAFQEYVKPELIEKNDSNADNAKKFVVAESPWIDLPDETAFEALGDMQTNVSENEHLRFLEHEQAGNE